MIMRQWWEYDDPIAVESLWVVVEGGGGEKERSANICLGKKNHMREKERIQGSTLKTMAYKIVLAKI